MGKGKIDKNKSGVGLIRNNSTCRYLFVLKSRLK
jgi:hypothetical protein